MEIGKLNITVEINKKPCIVLLKNITEEKKNLILEVVVSILGNKTLEVLPLNDNFKFIELTEKDVFRKGNE